MGNQGNSPSAKSNMNNIMVNDGQFVTQGQPFQDMQEIESPQMFEQNDQDSLTLQNDFIYK
jgi:hypothetical protein